MSRVKIFLAAPISAFENLSEYKYYREKILCLIQLLSKEHEVFSELTKISNISEYDNPAKAANEDFNQIASSDCFILFHPYKIQSSTLVELGYALALKKRIIILSNKTQLPYLVNGLIDGYQTVQLISTRNLDDDIINSVLKILE